MPVQVDHSLLLERTAQSGGSGGPEQRSHAPRKTVLLPARERAEYRKRFPPEDPVGRHARVQEKDRKKTVDDQLLYARSSQRDPFPALRAEPQVVRPVSPG